MSASLIGKVLGKYRIIEKLHSGGMADVYKGIQIGLDREVAIKVLPPAFAQDREMVKRFRRESQATAKLSHPNIITIYDSGEQGGFYFYVMEFLKNDSLEDVLEKEKPLPLAKSIKIGQDVLKALIYCHEKEIIHRDLKPANIKFDMRENAIVTDFGLVKDLGETAITQSGAPLGTPQYMSPEQIKGLEVDARSDLYQIGVIMYEMLTGQVPFDRRQILAGQTLDVRDARELNAGIPPDLSSFLRKALGRQVSDRFQSAKEMLAELRRIGLASKAARDREGRVRLRQRLSADTGRVGDNTSAEPPPPRSSGSTSLWRRFLEWTGETTDASTRTVAPGDATRRPSGRSTRPSPALPPKPTPRSIQKLEKMKIGEALIASGKITHEDLEEALIRQKQTGERLGKILVGWDRITERDVIEIVSAQLHVPVVELSRQRIDPAVAMLVREQTSRKHQVIAIGHSDGKLTLAMADPLDVLAVDEVELETGLQVKPTIATPTQVREALAEVYQSVPRAATPGNAGRPEPSEATRRCGSCGSSIPAAAETCCPACGCTLDLSAGTEVAPPEPGDAHGELDSLLTHPELVRKYKIIRKLGQGGMGVVYCAEQLDLGRSVALKFLLGPHIGGADLARFQRTGLLLARLSHPNVMRLLSVEVFGSTPAMVLELLEGKTLEDELRAVGRIPIARILSIALQVLGGLEAAHELGIVHRDVKPANILIAAADEVKILDFALARPTSAHRGISITGAGAIIGTPAYMSPEQCRGERIDRRSDLYSVGVVLFQMAAGRVPFTGSFPMEVVNKQVNEEPPDLAALVPGLPAPFVAVVRTALAKKPEDRFPTAIAFKNALAAVGGVDGHKRSGQLRTPAAPSTPLASSSERSPAPEPRPGAGSPAEVPAEPRRRSPTHIDLSAVRLDPHVVRLLSEQLARFYNAVAIQRDEDVLTIAMLQPDDSQAVANLRHECKRRLGFGIEVVGADAAEIEKVIKSGYQAVGHDVFISYRNTGRDAQIAAEMYRFLTQRGVEAFYSRESLPQMGTADYAKAINAALESAKILIAISTSREHLEAKWVEYEWGTYLKEMLSERKPQGSLFTYLDGINASALPIALRNVECVRPEDGGFERLYQFVASAVGPKKKP